MELWLKLFGFTVGAVTLTLLEGWYWLDWRFVDPFLTTLVLIAAPFFFVMGIVAQRPIPVVDYDRWIIPG